LNNHPAPTEKLRQVVELLKIELITKPISDIKIHLKLESLLKESPIDFWD